MKVIIVGGVAGGASCAARLRRLDESAEILMVERGPYVSYANCGLPYYIGGVIEQQKSLLVATADTFRTMFNVDARTDCEVVGISAGDHTVQLKDRHDRRGDHRALRQARALARRRPHPPAPAGDRPARHLRRADGARRRPDPRLDRRAARQGGRHGLLHGVPDPHEGLARGRGRRRLHRHRDGREPRRARLRGHAAAARRPDHGAARHRDGALRRAPSRQERRARHAQRRRVWLRGGRRRIARGPDRVGRHVPGRHRHPRHRGEARDRAGGDGGHQGRRARRHRRRRPDAHQRSRHLRGRRRRREDRLHHR